MQVTFHWRDYDRASVVVSSNCSLLLIAIDLDTGRYNNNRPNGQTGGWQGGRGNFVGGVSIMTQEMTPLVDVKALPVPSEKGPFDS